MKHLKIIFRTILLLFELCLVSTNATAQKDFSKEYLDSIEVSLLTCQPHDEIYSLYGHTALRWHDLHENSADLAFNWGVFNFHAPYFVARFVFGLTDYELGAYSYSRFQQEYRQFGSMVSEQVLNLTHEEKQKLYDALNENLKPENRIYRYNYFYNNCTTKARDIIEQCINGKIEYTEKEKHTETYREMIHEMTRNNPWNEFGIDLLLGLKADMKTNFRQQEFLPANLMHDFDHAEIYSDGNYRPLVKERRISVPAGIQIRKSGFPLTPIHIFIVLLSVGIITFILEWKNRCIYVLWDVILMVATGTIGIIIFLMLFSQHPTVNLNLQIVLLNPLPWFFLWKVIKGYPTHYWHITAVLCILFLIGSLFQNYAEGIVNLALCLLLQSILHIKKYRNE